MGTKHLPESSLHRQQTLAVTQGVNLTKTLKVIQNYVILHLFFSAKLCTIIVVAGDVLRHHVAYWRRKSYKCLLSFFIVLD